MPYVYAFEEGSKEQKYLLGGKGANLAEMTKLGLPVPPGLHDHHRRVQGLHGRRRHASPTGLMDEVADALAALEAKMGKQLGDATDPLLVSVRSGAPFSMPGMMDTVLNLGLNDVSVGGLAKQTGNARFAYDSYRRFVQMFGKIVLDIDGDKFEHALERAARAARASRPTPSSPPTTSQGLVDRFKAIVLAEAGIEFPQDPKEQLAPRDRGGVPLVERRARAHLPRAWRRSPTTSAPRSTCRRWCSATRATTPAPASRSPATRPPARTAPYGDFLTNAQGEDVVAGIRVTEPLDAMGNDFPECHQQLLGLMQTLENHYRDMCDIEFTIEQGRLFLLQTRVGKRTAAAALRMAVEMEERRPHRPARGGAARAARAARPAPAPAVRPDGDVRPRSPRA